MFRFSLIFFFTILTSFSSAEIKDKIIDMMEADGIVSKANHVGKRDVL